MTTQTKTCEFYVQGMHCAACEMLIEDELLKHTKVKQAKASLGTQKVSLQLENDITESEIQKDLNLLIKDFGYTLSKTQPARSKVDIRELGTAFMYSLIFVSFFIILQKLGIVNLLSSSQITYPFVFFIGIVASLSSCMAVVGVLVLSLSSTYAKEQDRNVVPLVKFHASRIISFFVLGGLIGLLGATFTLTPLVTFILNFLLFIVMLILGINLLDIYTSAQKMQLRLPKALSKAFAGMTTNKNIAPIILGISTFFLPCGFTQSMQLYSLTTGNFMSGALTMLVFSLGTLPVLALISAASIKLSKGLQSKIFFKTAGFIVLFFAVFNFLGALVATGLIKPIINI